VPAGYVQLGNTVLTTVGGNQKLSPETAKTLTLGLVWQPEQVKGLSLTVDYFDIKVEDAIRSIPGSTKLAICYASPGMNHPFCGPNNFTRSPLTGEVNFLSAQPTNAGLETMKGVDIGARYAFDLGDRRASLDWNTTYLGEYVVTPFLGADPIIFDGYIGGGNGGYPHWRSNVSASIVDERWTATYSVQLIGKATDFNAAPGDIGYETPNLFYHKRPVRLSPGGEGRHRLRHRQPLRQEGAVHPELDRRQHRHHDLRPAGAARLCPPDLPVQLVFDIEKRRASPVAPPGVSPPSNQ